MNKRETAAALKAGENLAKSFPLDRIEELLERYEGTKDELQEKIDRIEMMDEIGDATQERLEGYNERMENLDVAIEALEAMRDSFSDFEDALRELECYT